MWALARSQASRVGKPEQEWPSLMVRGEGGQKIQSFPGQYHQTHGYEKAPLKANNIGHEWVPGAEAIAQQ